MTELLAIGFGYSVAPLAGLLHAEGWRIAGTTRNVEKAERLAAQGVMPLTWDGEADLPQEVVSRADVIIVSVPPGDEGCPAVRAIKKVSARTTVIYLSSTGVYGDFDGAWIDEEAPCEPTSDRGRRRLLAEHQWRKVARDAGARLHICRLAGIYGPGRNAVESFSGDTKGARSGLSQRVIKPGQVFNRIHRDDIAAGLHALIKAEKAPQILNFADDEPAPPQDVITHAAKLLGIDPPPEIPFDEAEMSDMARSFYADNRRLKNARLKQLPGFSLTYPTYREGLQALLGD